MGFGLKNMREQMGSDSFRNKAKMLSVPLFLSIVSLCMALLDLILREYHLMYAALIFCAVSAVLAVIARISDKAWRFSYYSYFVVLTALFFYLLVSGVAEGMCVVWMCLLPTCGLLFWGRRDGTIFSAINFAMLVFFMWVPLGRMFIASAGYSDMFMLRFPVLYACFYFVGLFFEIYQCMTYDALRETQATLLELSVRDGMTGINNHAKFYKDLEALADDGKTLTVGFVYVDINGLKQVNDKQNHDAGDQLILVCVGILKQHFEPESCYRMGGDEFIAVIKNISRAEFDSRVDELREAYAAADGISVAIGCDYTTDISLVNQAVISADSNMLTNKAAYYERTGLDRRTGKGD